MTPRTAGQGYVVDPADPRAPPEEVWAAMSDEERARVVASLPTRQHLLKAGYWSARGTTSSEAVKRAVLEARAEENARRADDAERRLAEVLAEIEHLKRERS